MRPSRAVLYLALALAANAATAQDFAAAVAARAGDMEKLNFVDPLPAPDTVFIGADGSDMTLAAYHGQWVVLNFWATWCAPCREEMPTLSALQTALGAEGLEVVTIATGRNDPMAMQDFMAEIGVTNLPLHTDPRQALARAMGVMGLPVTLILDPQGNEVGRLLGDADWSSDSALAVLHALIH
jgi:thiol-disulfide isomerase/thioredoxin